MGSHGPDFCTAGFPTVRPAPNEAAGRAGAALAAHAFERGWIRRTDATRAVVVGTAGIAALRDAFDLVWRP